MATNSGILINSFFSFLMVIASLVFFNGLFLGILGGLIFIVISVFQGDKQRNKFINYGKKLFSIAFKSFVGLIIIAVAYAILTIIINFLGFNL